MAAARELWDAGLTTPGAHARLDAPPARRRASYHHYDESTATRLGRMPA